MKAHDDLVRRLQSDGEKIMHEIRHQQRNTGYQDAMHDLQEVIQKTDVRTGVAIWLAHGRNWKEHL